ncbi:FLD [Symbiodinium sp. CCMP2592]|nr:FLD [Symbiodinium sp. CCMP2592]
MLDVVIVGAGISGISCAKHIRASDGMRQHRIKVLEATDRTGQFSLRLQEDAPKPSCRKTAQLSIGAQPGSTADQGMPLGVIHDFATEKGLMLDKDWMSDPKWQWEVLPLRHLHGSEASPTEKQAFEEMESAFDSFTDKEAVGDQADEKSLGALLDEEFQKWAQQKEHDAAMMQTMFEFKKREMSSGVGSPDLYTASANGFVQAEDGFGHDCIPLPHGYSSIVDAMLKEVPGLEIQHGAAVKEATSHDDHVEITLENGDKLQARTVVFTVSVGVLKSGQIRFKPELPQEKQEAIQRMGFGHVEKCILTFDNDTWETLKHGVHCLWPPERDGYRNAVLNDWEQSIVAFYPNQPRSSRSLVAWIVADGFSNTSAPEKVMNLLRRCLGRDVPDPVETNLTNWGRDRRFLGSWSYLSAGQPLDAFGMLGKPFGRVFFGGEHTHPKYFGTAHGAYESGARCAQEVIEKLSPPL